MVIEQTQHLFSKEVRKVITQPREMSALYSGKVTLTECANKIRLKSVLNLHPQSKFQMNLDRHLLSSSLCQSWEEESIRPVL